MNIVIFLFFLKIFCSLVMAPSVWEKEKKNLNRFSFVFYFFYFTVSFFETLFGWKENIRKIKKSIEHMYCLTLVEKNGL